MASLTGVGLQQYYQGGLFAKDYLWHTMQPYVRSFQVGWLRFDGIRIPDGGTVIKDWYS